MQTFAKLVDAALRVFLVALVALLVTSVVWQVLSRYLFSSPSPWTEEMARFSLIWVGMLGASYAFRTRAHLGLELLPEKLQGTPAGTALKYFTLLVVAIFAVAVLVAGGAYLVMLTWELKQYSAVLGLPVAYVYSVIPLTGVLIAFYCVVQALTPDEAPLVDSTTGDF
jgi:TRAP-type C4-dicarboxylate transport system permease small subunit